MIKTYGRQFDMWCRSKKLHEHVMLFMLHSCVRVSITSPRRCPPLLPPASCNPNSLPKFSLIALSINSGLTCCGCGGEYPSPGSGLGTSAVWPQDADTTLHTISCGIKLQASCSRWYSFKLHCILAWELNSPWECCQHHHLTIALSGARGWPEVCSQISWVLCISPVSSIHLTPDH